MNNRRRFFGFATVLGLIGSVLSLFLEKFAMANTRFSGKDTAWE